MSGSPFAGWSKPFRNPVAPPMTLRMENDEVIGTVVFGQQYEGPPGHVHVDHLAGHSSATQARHRGPALPSSLAGVDE